MNSMSIVILAFQHYKTSKISANITVIIIRSHYHRRLGDTFSFPRALWVAETAAGFHAVIGFYHKVQPQSDLWTRGCPNMQYTFIKR